jgi:hypothetical protein
MSAQHLIPRRWDVPTPFRDRHGGRIYFALRRPSGNSLTLFAALAFVAHCTVPTMTDPSTGAYLASFAGALLLAVVAGRLVRRIVRDDRIVKGLSAVVVLAGLALSPVTSSTGAWVGLLCATGLIAIPTVIVELGCRASTRQESR